MTVRNIAAMTAALLIICSAIIVLPEHRAFDCRMLIGGWHPDVPATLAKKCREKQNAK